MAPGGGPAGRPRKERAENAAMRRRQVIDATMRSVVRNGLAGTTLATVSAEAGLSQGVAVFYFQNKQTLLGEALRQQYETYQEVWQQALAAAGPEPAARLLALVRSEFDPSICNSDSLVIWHAFWGEANARPIYAQIAEKFDNEHSSAMRSCCAELLAAAGRPADDATEIGAGIDALTDGLWLRLYLPPGPPDVAGAVRVAARFLSSIFPDQAGAFAAAMAQGAK